MRLYTPWFPPPGGNPERPPVLLGDGFSWWGLLLGWLVFLRPGSWLCAALTGLASLAAGLLGRSIDGGWALLAGMHLAVALFASDWRAWELRQAGFVPAAPVAGTDRDQALLRLLDREPALIGRPA